MRYAPVLLLAFACQTEQPSAVAPDVPLEHPSRPQSAPVLAVQLESKAPLQESSPPSKSELGTAHPLHWVAGSPLGTWAVFCQARKDTDKDGSIATKVGQWGVTSGDALKPVLVLGSGPGEDIDDFVHSDTTGRYLAIIKRGKLWGIDSVGAERRHFEDADPRDAPGPRHRAAFFDESGDMFLYHGTGKTPKIFVRVAGRETAIEPGPGALAGARIDGSWVVIEIAKEDTNGDGKITAPKPDKKLGSRVCPGSRPVESDSVKEIHDERVQRYVPASGGEPREIPDLIAIMGDSLLRREASGALVLEDTTGKKSELVGADCKARVLGVWPANQRVLLACVDEGAEDPAKNGRVELHGPGKHQKLAGLAIKMPDTDYAEEGRIVALRPDFSAIVDLETGAHHAFANAEVIASHEGRALVRSRATGAEEQLTVVDVNAGAQKQLPGTFDKYPKVVSSKRVALVSPWVIDIEAAAVLGRADDGFNVVDKGYVLVPAPATQLGSSGLPSGPLKWQWPTDPSAPKPSPFSLPAPAPAAPAPAAPAAPAPDKPPAE